MIEAKVAEGQGATIPSLLPLPCLTRWVLLAGAKWPHELHVEIFSKGVGFLWFLRGSIRLISSLLTIPSPFPTLFKAVPGPMFQRRNESLRSTTLLCEKPESRATSTERGQVTETVPVYTLCDRRILGTTTSLSDFAGDTCENGCCPLIFLDKHVFSPAFTPPPRPPGSPSSLQMNRSSFADRALLPTCKSTGTLSSRLFLFWFAMYYPLRLLLSLIILLPSSLPSGPPS